MLASVKISFPERAIKKTLGLVAGLKTVLVDRVGRCEQTGADKDGNRTCPAFNSEVVRTLIDGALQPKEA